MTKTAIALGTVQETLLITLWARATETRKADPILRDTKSLEILEQIDYDFSKLATAKASQVGVCLRGMLFDRWVKAFLQQYPNGTVVEIGSGLNTRFERLDNGTVHWFDLDLPDAIAVRRRFFVESKRRQLISASVLDLDWIDRVKASASSPFMFVAEGVLMYLTEAQVKQVFSLLVQYFSGCSFAFDSMSPFIVKSQKRHDVMKHYEARFEWGIKDICSISTWDSRYQVREITTFYDLPLKDYLRAGLFNCLLFAIPPLRNAYRLSLVQLG
jgi:O-methyltransferase involved in polyketide biosynthesis